MARLSTYSKTLRSGEVATYHRVRFEDLEGRPKTKDFPTKREALTFARNLGQPVSDAPAVEDSQTLSFEEATTAFIRASEIGRDGGVPLEKTTLSAYRQCFDRMKGREFYKLPLPAITRDHIRGLRDYCLNERGLSRSTARSTIVAARVLFNWGIEEGLCLANPTANVKIAKDVRAGEGEPVRRDQIHSRAEVKKLLDTMDALAADELKIVKRAWLRYRPMIHLALLAGMRLSEIRGLPWKGLDLDAGLVTIEQRADANGDVGNVKTQNSYRTLPLAARTVDAIRAWVEERGGNMKAGDLVFPEFGKMEEAIDPQNFGRNCWRKLLSKAKVKRLKFHATRHFYASAHIANGTVAKDLCALMGHHSEAFTLATYGHLFDEAQDGERRRKSVDAVAAMVL